MTKNNKIWENSGGPTQQRSYPTQRKRSTQRRRVPTPQRGREGDFGQAQVRRGEARSSATPQRSHCSQHGKLLCFVLFRYSVILRTCL